MLLLLTSLTRYGIINKTSYEEGKKGRFTTGSSSESKRAVKSFFFSPLLSVSHKPELLLYPAPVTGASHRKSLCIISDVVFSGRGGSSSPISLPFVIPEALSLSGSSASQLAPSSLLYSGLRFSPCSLFLDHFVATARLIGKSCS